MKRLSVRKRLSKPLASHGCVIQKPRNNALHAFCGIETIELPLRSSHKKSLFEPRTAPSRQHYGKAFIIGKINISIQQYFYHPILNL